jgi:hypothetical protein
MSTSTSNISSVPPAGLNFPTQKPYEPGASSPGQSALLAQQNASSKQTALITMGGRKRKLKGGDYVVPQFQMSYVPQGGPGQNPNEIITQTAATSTQTVANQQYDNLVGQKAGTKICHNGETGCWGCYSGGKKKKRTIKRRTVRKKNKKYSKKRKTYRK